MQTKREFAVQNEQTYLIYYYSSSADLYSAQRTEVMHTAQHSVCK